MIGIVSSKTNQLEDVIYSFGGDCRHKPELNVSIISLSMMEKKEKKRRKDRSSEERNKKIKS